MEDLYQEIILDHNKRPRNYGPLAEATHQAAGRNPLCGDELHVSLCLEKDRLREIKFQGQGCAISKASASLMTEALRGRTTGEARSLVRNVVEGLTGSAGEWAFEDLGDLAALSGVRKYPARIKCATLAWHAALGALEGKPLISTEASDS